jgi:hypothetical protein
MTRHGAVESSRATKGAAALLFAVVGLGCGMPPGQFVIIQNQVPTGEGCGIPASITPAYRGSGDLDVRLVSSGASLGYAVFPVMKNNLAASAEASDLNRIKVDSFDVDIELPEELAQLANDHDADLHYSIKYSASVSSGGGSTSAAVNAIPAALARAIRDTGYLTTMAFAELTTTIRARGETDSGRSVTSDPFVFPVRLCDGCLIASTSACDVAPEPTHLGNACNVAQDDAVDCCTSGTNLVCPSSGSAQ